MSFVPCEESAFGSEGAAGELDDNVPEANFHAPSKTVFHENGTVGEESSADGVGASGSGSTEGIADGSAAKIDSPGSVRSGTGTDLGNCSDTNPG
jgi:hypothetical protein